MHFFVLGIPYICFSVRATSGEPEAVDEVRDIPDQKAFFPDEYESDYLLTDSTNSEVKSSLHLYNVITKGEM